MGTAAPKLPSPATKSVVAIALLLTCSRARACELSLVAPSMSVLKNPVQVHTSLADDALTVRFAVASPSINAKKRLAPNERPYEFDVVEVFVTFSDNGFPYFEFEVSPYNQTFQVRIVSRREHHEGVELGLTSTAEISRSGWTAQLNVPLKPLGWDGDANKIRGNLYSVVGPSKKRSYWSAFLPKTTRPDFHRPEYFKPLLQC